MVKVGGGRPFDYGLSSDTRSLEGGPPFILKGPWVKQVDVYYALPAPYESAVTDRHTIWLIFLDEKKGKWGWIRTRRTHTNFCSKKFCGMCTIKIVPTHSRVRRVGRGAGRA
jgi:hypothetical protein